MMSEQPLISVIMPCFNAESLLARSIASVFNQTFSDLELIVVNDGSSDDSADILNTITDPRLTVVHQKNSGVCHARNKALSVSNGQFIAFLDADDTWEPDCLMELHRALTASDATLAYCGWQNIGLPGGQGEPYIPEDYETPQKLSLLFESCRWPIHACLTYKTAIVEAGMFDENIQTSEDYLLWLKIAMVHTLVCVPRVLAYYHFHGAQQATSNKAKVAINHFITQKLFLQQYPLVKAIIGATKTRSTMYGQLLKRGYDCYWQRELKYARAIFRFLLLRLYAPASDLKYMLPALLPYSAHRKLITRFESNDGE